jgi:CheY-like chemotaxis protein/anti-sigma regulatory factor (Ser/Thr protein kinase)
VAFVEAAIATAVPAAEAKGVRIESVLDPAAGPVAGDSGRLQQVVWNLLSNAVKFTPKGGRVQVRLARIDSQIEISVADTGAGLVPEFIPHVFERFSQADPSITRPFGGLGLGLSIVKNLVELHGGTVHVASPGENLGATFSVRLPLMVVHDHARDRDRMATPSPLQSTIGFAQSDLAGVKVLVVDDEPDSRELVRRVLAECGADIDVAADAHAAVEAVQRFRPHVLISDIGMPGVDGYRLLQKVRALGAQAGGNVPAIALTAFARTEDRTQALHAGFLVHLAKPIELAELVATVAAVVGRTGAGGADNRR